MRNFAPRIEYAKTRCSARVKVGSCIKITQQSNNKIKSKPTK